MDNIGNIASILGLVFSVVIFIYTRKIDKSIRKVKKNILFSEKAEEYTANLEKCNKSLENEIETHEKTNTLNIERCLSCISTEVKKIIDIIPLIDCDEETKIAKQIKNKIEELTGFESRIRLKYSVSSSMLPPNENENKISKQNLGMIYNKTLELIGLLHHKLSTKKTMTKIE